MSSVFMGEGDDWTVGMADEERVNRESEAIAAGQAPKDSSIPEPLSVKGNMLWNTVGSFVYLVCNWLITVLVVVLGGAVASGGLAVSMAVGNIMATIVLFRVRPVQVSDVRGDYATGDFVMLRIISSGVAIAFCLVYCLLTVSAQNYLYVLLYCLFKLVDSFVDVFHGIDQLHGRLDYSGVSQILRGVLVLVSFVGGMVLFGGLAAALALMVVTSLAVVVLYDVPKSGQFGAMRPIFSRRRIVSLFATCMPGFVASLMVTMVVSLSRQVFGMQHGDDLLGIYAAVATPTVVVQALASYIYAPLLGPIAEHWDAARTDKIAKTLAGVLGVVAIVTALGIVVGMLFGEIVLSAVYGPTVGSHADLLSAMLACTAFSASMFFLVDMLIVFRDAIGSACSAAVSLLVCVLAMGPMLQSSDMNSISMLILVAYGAGIAVALGFVWRGLRKRKAAAASTEA